MDDIQRAKNDFKNLSFMDKIEHVWYYYKWFIVFGAIVLIFLLICLTQCSTRKAPDAMIMYVGPYKIYSDYYDNVDYAMSEIMSDDHDGNGYKSCDLLEIVTTTGDDDARQVEIMLQELQQQPDTQQRLYLELTTGTSIIYLVDPGLYSYIKNFLGPDEYGRMREFLVPLDDILGYVPENAYDEYGICLSDLDCYSATDMKYMDKNAILCIRRQRTTSYANNDSDEFYASNVSFMRDLIEWKKTEG